MTDILSKKTVRHFLSLFGIGGKKKSNSEPKVNSKLFFVFAFFSEFLFIYSFYITYFNKHGFHADQLAFLIIIMNVSKMLFDLPAGIFADLVSRRNLIMFGLVAKAIFCGLCFSFDNYHCLLAAMAFYGVGNSCIYYHTEAYIFDNFKTQNKENKYPQFMGAYYAIGNIAIAVAAFTGDIIFKIFSFKGVFAASIGSLLVASLVLMRLPNYKVNERISSVFHVKNAQNIATLFKRLIKKPNIVRLMILAIILDAMFIVMIDMNTSLMNALNMSTSGVSQIVGAVGLIRVATNYFSGHAVRFMTFKRVHSFLLLLMLASMFLSLRSGYYLVGIISAYLCVYPFFDMSIKTKIQNRIDSSTRATILSFASIGASICAIAMNSFVGVISTNYGYKTTPFALALLITALLLVVRNLTMFYRVDKNIRKIVRKKKAE